MIVDDLVQSELNRSISILIDRAWRLPSPDDRVYDLWTIPSDKVSKDFAMFSRDIAKSAGQRACFTPHMYISDGVRSHCQGNLDENFCYNLCTNNKRFCATDSDNVAVADVVRKSLRRLCKWNTYGSAMESAGNDGTTWPGLRYVAVTPSTLRKPPASKTLARTRKLTVPRSSDVWWIRAAPRMTNSTPNRTTNSRQRSKVASL